MIRRAGCRCPAHNDTGEGRPNLAIYKEAVHCFRCDFHADAIGLVEKTKNLDFKAALAYLADFVGMPPKDKAQGLGNRNGADNGKAYPKAAPLPPGPSPTLGKVKTEDLGNKEETTQEEAYPKTRPASTDGRPPLPRNKWVAGVADFGEARSLQLELSKEYITELGKDAQGFYIAAPAFDIEEETPASTWKQAKRFGLKSSPPLWNTPGLPPTPTPRPLGRSGYRITRAHLCYPGTGRASLASQLASRRQGHERTLQRRHTEAIWASQ